MKKRLRKKLHIKEFAEYGIEFEMIVTSPIKEEVFNSMMEQFVENFVERNEFVCGGGWNLKMKKGGFIVEIGRNIEKVSYYLPELKKWFEEKNIKIDLKETPCFAEPKNKHTILKKIQPNITDFYYKHKNTLKSIVLSSAPCTNFGYHTYFILNDNLNNNEYYNIISSIKKYYPDNLLFNTSIP